MHSRNRTAATALSLLLATPAAQALPRQIDMLAPSAAGAPLILAQTEPPAEETEEQKQKRLAAEQKAAEEAAAAQKAAEEAAAQKAAEEAAAQKAAEEAAAQKAAAEEAARKAAEEKPASDPTQPIAPESVPQPAPEATPQPAPEATPQPAPETAPQPAPEATPQPVPEATPQPTPEAVPQPTPEAVPQPSPEAAPQPAPEPAPQPAPEATPQPSPEAAPQPEAGAPPPMEPVPENLAGEAAPVLDSAKEELSPPPEGAAPAPPPPAPAETAAPPADDQTARVDIAPVAIEPVRAEEGVRIAAPPPLAPPPADVVQIIDNRTLVTINTVVVVVASDEDRLARDDEVIVERLSRGRVRETVVRPNGVQVVTVRNRFGEIIRRSRILPDGREVVLTWAPEYDSEDQVVWRDPVYDLPPLRLRIPLEDYILDARDIEDPDRYYEFLDEPPVERVERVYSLQDVRRSARVRDKARRIEMGNIGFAFGSADIAEAEIDKLDGLANAMARLIEKNPAEMFLIEGHTDAVGSPNANLALSDRRAESVARALTDVFGIPPENLTTQGFGERFLKVKTEAREPLNRRVVFRRITPLVAPNVAAE